MSPNECMRPKGGRGFLHFVHATNAATLDQMDQLKYGTAFLILNMHRIVDEYEVSTHAVGAITLRKDGYPVTSLPRQYIQYALGRQGQRLTLRGNTAGRWSTHLGDEPPAELKQFFTRANSPANLITLSGVLLRGLKSIYQNEMTALERCLRESRQHLADNIVQGQGYASASNNPPGQRAAEGGYWQLQPHEKYFEVHRNVTSNVRHFVGELQQTPAWMLYGSSSKRSDLLKKGHWRNWSCPGWSPARATMYL